MKILLYLLLPWAIPVLAAAPSYAPPVFQASTVAITVPLVLRDFEDIDEQLQTLSAQYTQDIQLENGGESSQSVKGSIDYKRRGLMRLEQHRPEHQTVIADGRWLWVWRPSTNQVIQSKLDSFRASQPLVQGLMDFGSLAKMLKLYQARVASVSEPDPSGHRRFELRLTPKDKTSDFTLTLRISTRDYLPLDYDLRANGMRIRSLLSQVRYNPPLAGGLFEFAPPSGAEVFQNFKSPERQ